MWNVRQSIRSNNSCFSYPKKAVDPQSRAGYDLFACLAFT